jgi:hypothetical protein
MCGGGDYSYLPSKPEPPTWNKFWDEVALPKEDVGIFIEVTRGCESVSCKLQCQARGIPKMEMPFDSLSTILQFLKGHSHPEIMLYGVGDVSNYRWGKFFKDFHREMPGRTRINLSPTANDDDIVALARKNVSIHFNVNTPEEAILANMKYKKLGCRMGSLIVPVANGVDWLEIMKISTIDIEFNSFTPSWSKRYVSADEFKDSLMSLGIEVSPTTYTLKSGFKILIETCETDEKNDKMTLTIRRCFQPDSERIKLDFLGMNIKKNRNCKEVYSTLTKLSTIKPQCNKCSRIVWYYNFKR